MTMKMHYVVAHHGALHYVRHMACRWMRTQWCSSASTVPTRLTLASFTSGYVRAAGLIELACLTRVLCMAQMNILRRVPRAVLWLYAPSNHTQASLRREAAAGGVAPERLLFASRVNQVGPCAFTCVPPASFETMLTTCAYSSTTHSHRLNT